MKFLTEPAREIPVAVETDVIVLGAGPAGFSAAVCAAREGARVLLLEGSGDLGGTATMGLMSHWIGRTKGGFYEEILDRSMDPTDNPGLDETFGGSARQIINPEKLKNVMAELLAESGAKLRLSTRACEPVMEGDTIRGVFAESKSGREAFLADVVIDATGDGDIAAKAGVPFTLGRETDGKMQPASMLFKLGGVDYDRAVFPGRFEDETPVPAGILQRLAKEQLRAPLGHVLLVRSTLPGVVTCNMTNVPDVDGTDAAALTDATLVCRRQMEEIVAFLRRYAPGYENCYLMSAASGIGIRETRHFHGQYVLTEQDILEAKEYPDRVVTNAHFNFDIHNMSGAGLDETGVTASFPQRKGYSIPYRCLLPQRVKRLLLAGRDISGTHMAHSNYRVMPICANLGQAAGTAAALSIRQGVTPDQLDVKDLQEALRGRGVLI